MGHDLNDEELKATRDNNGANICVGDYVRDKWEEIHKVYKIEKDSIYCDKPNIKNPPFDTYGCRYYEDKTEIVKHSKNIIDLIEIGDYVNGYKVLKKTKTKNGCTQICIYSDNEISCYREINDKTLKTIVTKEQFNSIAYRLEE